MEYHDDGLFPTAAAPPPPHPNTNDDIEQSPAQGGIVVEGDLEQLNRDSVQYDSLSVLIAFSKACFEFADEGPEEALHGSLSNLPIFLCQPSSRPFVGCCCGVLRVGASLPLLTVAMLCSSQPPRQNPRTNLVLRRGAYSALPVQPQWKA